MPGGGPSGGGGGGGGGGGDIDFGGFDNADMEAQGSAAALVGGAHKLSRRDVMTTTMAMVSNAMNLESVLTVPNNAWNAPTTPNLFDFIAVKVSGIII